MGATAGQPKRTRPQGGSDGLAEALHAGRVQAVTLADVRRTFERVLQPDRMVTVVVGAKP